MNCQKSRSGEPVKRHAERVKRAAIYIAPSAYGEPVDLKEALKQSRAYVKKKKDLKLMRIYRDEQVEVIGSDAENGRRSPLGVKGNDAWNQLLVDIETSAVEAVLIYAARTVAPTISGLANMVRDYFLPCGIRFIDVEAEFDTADCDGDTADGDTEAYLKAKTSEYRSTVKHKPHKPYKKNKPYTRKKKEGAEHGQTEPGGEIDTAVLEENHDSGVADSPLCETVG